MATILSSLWDGLSPHLIASFYEVGRDGRRIEGQDIEVQAPLLDGASLSITLNWQSAFENAGPETKAPALFAMLQAGALQPVVDQLFSGKGSSNGQQKSSEFLKKFEGRTGMTKLNSTQIFSGMPPASFTVTPYFRAWMDSVSEVEEPFDQLMKWSLSPKLANDATLLSNAVNYAKGDKGFIDALLPSESPKLIAMRYKRMVYGPLVIESIEKQLDAPVDSEGRHIDLAVPMKISTLAAIDRSDWANFKSGQR
jgi:hypothetical protein